MLGTKHVELVVTRWFIIQATVGTVPSIPIVGVGKERRVLIGPWSKLERQ